MDLRLTVSAAFALMVFATAARADQAAGAEAGRCKPLVFKDGYASVTAQIPAWAPDCYSFNAVAGQQATLHVGKADQMLFATERFYPDGHRNDASDELSDDSFTTETVQYHVLVASQARKGDTSHSYTFTATLK